MSAAEALDLWNEVAARCGWPLVRCLTSDRERKLRALLRNSLDDWKEALAKAEASDFLRGRTDRPKEHQGWRLNIDTMLRESFFVRLLEGNYDNREVAQSNLKSPETILWEARLRGYRPGGMWLAGWGPKPEDPSCHAPKSSLSAWREKHLQLH